jgi:hypothetical protein
MSCRCHQFLHCSTETQISDRSLLLDLVNLTINSKHLLCFLCCKLSPVEILIQHHAEVINYCTGLQRLKFQTDRYCSFWSIRKLTVSMSTVPTLTCNVFHDIQHHVSVNAESQESSSDSMWVNVLLFALLRLFCCCAFCVLNCHLLRSSFNIISRSSIPALLCRDTTFGPIATAYFGRFDD